MHGHYFALTEHVTDPRTKFTDPGCIAAAVSTLMMVLYANYPGCTISPPAPS